jgi:hypothetical protein
MSVDQVTEEIRAQLLSGARRRLRRERMRVWIGAAVAVIAVVAGLTTAVVRSHDSTRVTTVATPGDQAAFAVCDGYLTIKERLASLDPIERSDWDALAQKAAATDDAKLAALVAKARDEWAPQTFTAAYNEATVALTKHCTDIGDPNYNAHYVPIELGPQPAVDLRAYGEPQLFEFAEQPPKGPQGPTPPVGRDLSPVEIGVTGQGGYVMSWSYAGEPSGTTSCLSYGSTSVLRLQSCVGQGNVKDGELFRGLQTADRMTTLPVPAETSFVVIESSSDRYVQRPAAQTVVILWKRPLNQTPVTAREYDANGTELRCHGAC